MAYSYCVKQIAYSLGTTFSFYVDGSDYHVFVDVFAYVVDCLPRLRSRFYVHNDISPTALALGFQSLKEKTELLTIPRPWPPKRENGTIPMDLKLFLWLIPMALNKLRIRWGLRFRFTLMVPIITYSLTYSLTLSIPCPVYGLDFRCTQRYFPNSFSFGVPIS